MTAEHPFARFIRTIGKGAQLARPLAREEAEQAMGLILAGAVEPVQIGAFLMLLRYRGETADEIAGFVAAGRQALVATATRPTVDLDWPSYADRHKQLPYFILAALLLAENGVRVLMHGIAGSADGFTPTPAVLEALGIAPARSIAEAADQLDHHHLAYLPLAVACPTLDRLFGLRPLLGLRSPVNTAARALNPFVAPCQLQGVFHPPYRLLHQEVATRLDQRHAAIFKGGGGEVQRNPEKPCQVLAVADGALATEDWPALIPGSTYPWREESTEIGRIVALWRGDSETPAPTAAVIGTVAVALRLLGRADGPAGAERIAADLWRNRRAAAGRSPRVHGAGLPALDRA